MHLEFNTDQTTFLTFLDQMLNSADAEFRTVPDWGRYDYGAELDGLLEENGFYDAASEGDLGPVAAAEMIYEAAQKPVGLECAASALLRPFLGCEVPRPLAVVVDDAPGAIRYLPVARTLVSIADTGVRVALLKDVDIEPVESLYAYPMGQIEIMSLVWNDLQVDPDRLKVHWRIAVAAELAGTLKGALDSVLDHVRERVQFGRPLGSLQAVQHRLAINEVDIQAARMLVLRAAQSLTLADATLALGFAQGFAKRVGYDLHQFMGAMGLTLEHPLHRWTYRARLLRADLGGAPTSYADYAKERWGPK